RLVHPIKNIRVVAKYYTRIRTKRLTQLLDLNDQVRRVFGVLYLSTNLILNSVLQDTEDFLSKLVVSKTIYAKIDRPAGIVSFAAPKDANQALNDWSNNINSLLNLI